MISFSSLPMFAGSLASGIMYTGLSLFTTATQATAHIALTTADTVLGIVGGPWIQMPFRVVHSIAKPVAEKTVQTATLGISLATGAVVGGTVFLGQKLFTTRSAVEKLKSDPKNEEWVVISAS